MKRGNIPTKDESFDIWQANFINICQANATAWGLGSLAALVAAQAIWAAAWAVAKIRASRSQADVLAKDEARAAYEALLRPFIQQYIMVNALISNTDRELMEIKPRATEHSPIPKPETVPAISTEPTTGNRVKIFFRQQPDAQGVSRRGKPEGVKYCEFAFTLDNAPSSPEECTGRSIISRSPAVTEFGPAEAGHKVYLFARWVNPRGEGGPWTNRTEFVIP